VRYLVHTTLTSVGLCAGQMLHMSQVPMSRGVPRPPVPQSDKKEYMKSGSVRKAKSLDKSCPCEPANHKLILTEIFKCQSLTDLRRIATQTTRV
jgi:hypothetical protein